MEPLAVLKILSGGGSVRFFVGENGFVREFRTPPLLDSIARLSNVLGR